MEPAYFLNSAVGVLGAMSSSAVVDSVKTISVDASKFKVQYLNLRLNSADGISRFFTCPFKDFSIKW
jgi:hypothetical protein